MALIFVIAAAAALLWTVLFFRQGSLIAGGLLFLVIGYCFGHEYLSFDWGSLPLTIDRLFLGSLVAAYLVQRVTGRLAGKALCGADWLLLSLVAALSLSTALTASQYTIHEGGSPLWRLVTAYWMPFALYWMVRGAPLGESQLRWVLAGMTLFGVYLSLTAVAEATQQWWFVFPQYIADPNRGIHFGRARGPALASHNLGLVLSLCLLCAWLLRRLVRRPFQCALWAVYPLMLAAIYFTYTRAVWLAAAAGLVTVLFVEVRRAWRALLVCSGLAAAILLAVTQAEGLVGMRRETSEGDSRHSVLQRAGFAYVSWQMFLDRPIFGVGFGNFVRAKLDYLADRRFDMELDSLRELEHHNTFLSVLTETGIVGLALLAALLVAWWRAGWSLAGDVSIPAWQRTLGVLLLGVVSIYFFPAMFHDVTLSPSNQWFTFYLAGLAVGHRQSAVDQGD